jgi:hypothetical protein
MSRASLILEKISISPKASKSDDIDKELLQKLAKDLDGDWQVTSSPKVELGVDVGEVGEFEIDEFGVLSFFVRGNKKAKRSYLSSMDLESIKQKISGKTAEFDFGGIKYKFKRV